MQTKEKRLVFVFVTHSTHLLWSTQQQKRNEKQLHSTIKLNVVLTRLIADQMARQYTVKAGTWRWPVAVFYNILDLACINAYVLYKKKTKDAISRRNFMFQLATELREAHVQGKTAPLAAVLPPLLNNSYQNLIVDGSRK